MSIIDVAEIRGRSGSLDVKLNHQRRARYRVKTDSLLHGPVSVMNATGVPPHYFPDPDNAISVVLNKTADQDEKNPYYWIVTCEYGIPENEDPEDAPNPEDPETRRPIWFRGTWKYTKNIIKDKDDKLLVNTAGQPFAEGVDLEYGGLMYRYTLWKSATGESLWGTHLFKVNNATWQGHTTRKALLTDIQVEEERVNGILYYKRTYEVLINPETWDEKILNRGFCDLSTGKLVHIKDEKGQPITEPWWLNAAGTAPRPQPAVAALNIADYTRSFQIRGTATFSDLW